MIKRNINLIVKLILIIIFIGLLMIIHHMAEVTSIELPESTPTPTPIFKVEIPQKVLNDSPILFTDLTYSVYYNSRQTEELLLEVQNSINQLKKVDNSEYTTEASKAIKQELTRLKKLRARVASDLKQYQKWEDEYYYATKVWEYFMQRDYGSVVTSAIIRNMMIETSGGTLALNPNIYDPTRNYYGLCQWSLEHYPDIKGLSFEQQLDYLVGNMPEEFNTFGWLYKEGFTYEDFLVLEDPKEAALIFAKVYERCGSASYKLRQKAALKAYKYFNL